MSQIKIYGIKSHLQPKREKLSDTLHACIMEAFQYPKDKRAHRFFYLEKEDFYYPKGRTDNYTIIEISLFEGRSVEAKKKFYQLIFERFETELGIMPQRCGDNTYWNTFAQLGDTREERGRVSAEL